MKKLKEIVLLVAAFGLVSFSLQGADAPATKPTKVGDLPKKGTPAAQAEEDDEDDIMERDEESGTDVLAIPFDDSEVEDELQINKDEKKNVFNLPKAK